MNSQGQRGESKKIRKIVKISSSTLNSIRKVKQQKLSHQYLNLRTAAEVVNDVVNGTKIQIANIFKTFVVVKM